MIRERRATETSLNASSGPREKADPAGRTSPPDRYLLLLLLLPSRSISFPDVPERTNSPRPVAASGEGGRSVYVFAYNALCAFVVDGVRATDL